MSSNICNNCKHPRTHRLNEIFRDVNDSTSDLNVRCGLAGGVCVDCCGGWVTGVNGGVVDGFIDVDGIADANVSEFPVDIADVAVDVDVVDVAICFLLYALLLNFLVKSNVAPLLNFIELKLFANSKNICLWEKFRVLFATTVWL